MGTSLSDQAKPNEATSCCATRSSRNGSGIIYASTLSKPPRNPLDRREGPQKDPAAPPLRKAAAACCSTAIAATCSYLGRFRRPSVRRFRPLPPPPPPSPSRSKRTQWRARRAKDLGEGGLTIQFRTGEEIPVALHKGTVPCSLKRQLGLRVLLRMRPVLPRCLAGHRCYRRRRRMKQNEHGRPRHRPVRRIHHLTGKIPPRWSHCDNEHGQK